MTSINCTLQLMTVRDTHYGGRGRLQSKNLMMTAVSNITTDALRSGVNFFVL